MSTETVVEQTIAQTIFAGPVETVVERVVTTELVTENLGPAGPPGPASAAISYEHVQASASTLWTVNHNFGRFPLIQVFSVGGSEVDASILHLTVNTAQISFNLPTAGTARAI